MKIGRRLLLSAVCLSLAWTSEAVERVEIVIDNSADMWRGLGPGPPQFVGLRNAVLNHAAASLHRQGRPEVALRIAGGGIDPPDPCRDTELVMSFALIDPGRWFEAMSGLEPRGGRPLAAALRAAAADVADAPDKRRIVLITAGGTDDCREDVIGILRSITTADPPIDLRVIGLGFDRETRDAAAQLVPTRNLSDIAGLGPALMWALQPADTRPIVLMPFEIGLTMGGRPAKRSEIVLTGPEQEEPILAVVRNGEARLRTAPGRYRAAVSGPDLKYELAGLVLGLEGARVDLDMFLGPPPTLMVEPERPTAGGRAFVRFWGAPAAGGWIAVSTPEAPLDEFLLLNPVSGGAGEQELPIPDSPRMLEIRFLIEAAPGVLQLAGRTPLTTDRPVIEIGSPDEVEIRAPMTIEWRGSELPGAFITVVPDDAPAGGHVICIAVRTESGSTTVPAPVIPGRHEIRFVSSWGHVLESKPLRVFEVLATLEAPEQAGPAIDVPVAWTGPDNAQDYLSIAADGSAAQEYISWAPTSAGSPVLLRTPSSAGAYEIRYVLGSDGEVLARQPLKVLRAAVHIEAPRSVEAGTRFAVTWRGTAGPGDLIAVVRAGTKGRKWFDFAYVDQAASVTLAAPFRPGSYEVRYISGDELRTLAEAPLRVR
jgi:Ca-activated chloride channel family protein